MNPKKILLIMVALGAVLVAFMLTRSFLSTAQEAANQPIQQVEEDTTEILVAMRDLPVGTIVAETDFEFKKWPKTSVIDNHYSAGVNPADLATHVVRNSVTAGQPITKSSLVSPGERGFLAAALRPGMRAVTVQVSATSGVGGFVFPGDRVDLILTHTISTPTEEGFNVAETVLKNVRVLGLDQRSEVDAPTPQTSKTATLEVTPKLAEKIALLETSGKLTLSLRSLAQNNTDTDGVDAMPTDKNRTHTFGAELTDLKANPGDSSVVTTVRVSRGSRTQTVKFSKSGAITGDDQEEGDK